MKIYTEKILVNAIAGAQKKKTSSYTTTAEVTSVTEDSIFVRLQGSEKATPIKDSSVTVNVGDYVDVFVSHSDTHITGNRSDVALNSTSTRKIVTSANGAYTAEMLDFIAAKYATFDYLQASYASIDTLDAVNATIENLQADNATITGKLTAVEAVIGTLSATYATINYLESKYATIDTLNSTYATIAALDSTNATIENLSATYANINFTNIGDAAIQTLYAQSGLIKNVIVKDQITTGEIVGVTISGDLIIANTLKADRLVLKGTNGLYYQLNTNGVTVAAEQTKYNALNGDIIIAKSITADKVNVSDLAAFDATIGGFVITSTSLYSGVKESAGNTTRGVYMDNTGQAVFGDSSNYIKYYYDSEESKWKLKIKAEELTFGASESSSGTSVETFYDTVTQTTETLLSESLTGIFVEYALSDSETVAPTSGWSTTAPAWVDGLYMWQRTGATTHGAITYSSVTCISGAKGATGEKGENGEDAVMLIITSSEGNAFKNTAISTVLSVTIYNGSEKITDAVAMREAFGGNAFLQWSYKAYGDEDFTAISLTDSRISDDGFMLTVTADTVYTKCIFACDLITADD